MYLQPILDAREREDYVEAHVLLMQILEASADPDALLLLADNIFDWRPESTDPFAIQMAAVQSALTAFRENDDRAGEGRALMSLAHADHGRTVELAKSALTIAREVGDTALMAHAMCHLGNEASIAGRQEEAIETVREGVRLAEETGGSELLADSLFVLGVVGDHEAFGRMAQLDPPRKRRFAYRLSAAASAVRENDPALAIAWCDRCLSIAREVSDPQLEGAVLAGLARIERARGNIARADDLEAMSSVMCPLPDMTGVIKAAEHRDMGAMTEAVKAMLGIR